VELLGEGYLQQTWQGANWQSARCGGVLLTGYGWRSIFLVNLPICALGLALAFRFVPESPLARKLNSFDLSGQFLTIAALTGLIGAVIEVRPLTGRTGSRTPMVLGGLIGAVGYALLSQLGPGTTFMGMLPGFVLIPLGIGLAVPAMTTTILSSADQTRSGTVSALLNAARQTGGALGVATFGTLISGEASGQILGGVTIVAWAAAALSATAALVALRIVSGGMVSVPSDESDVGEA
jgi:predicted MFS family arabinose efflux permease